MALAVKDFINASQNARKWRCMEWNDAVDYAHDCRRTHQLWSCTWCRFIRQSICDFARCHCDRGNFWLSFILPALFLSMTRLVTVFTFLFRVFVHRCWVVWFFFLCRYISAQSFRMGCKSYRCILLRSSLITRCDKRPKSAINFWDGGSKIWRSRPASDDWEFRSKSTRWAFSIQDGSLMGF